MVGAIVITIKPNVSKDNIEVLSLESDVSLILETALAICIQYGGTYVAEMYSVIDCIYGESLNIMWGFLTSDCFINNSLDIAMKQLGNFS
jgi:hypothetical protein